MLKIHNQQITQKLKAAAIGHIISHKNI